MKSDTAAFHAFDRGNISPDDQDTVTHSVDINLVNRPTNTQESEQTNVDYPSGTSGRSADTQERTEGEGQGGPGPVLGTYPALDFQGFFR